ncbi:MAG: PLP-dependent aminotransferase family protein [Anaerolineae bacterium]|nr:PLP-dependent aminotransferase family protein [Anaerolineae bacterium]
MLNLNELYSNRAKRNAGSFLRQIFPRTRAPGVINFAGGLPNPDFFPVEPIIAATEKAMRADGRDTLQYGLTEGLLGLREWIAARYERQGLKVSPDQILITNGSQQGIDLVGRVFLDPGDKMVIEAPGYMSAIQSFAMYEPQFIGVGLSDEGIVIDELAEVLKNNRVKLMETCPSFQNPSGLAYSTRTRERLAALVSQHNTLVVEDDPYAELRFMGSETKSLQAYLGEQVITLGSFSKIVAPGFRLGWTVASPEITRKLILAKQLVDIHTNLFAQRVLLEYLRDGNIDGHINQMRGVYLSQRNAMVDAMTRYFPPETTFTKPEGGMFVWVTLPEDADAMALFNLSMDTEKVAFVPGLPFYTDGKGKNQMRLSFSTQSPEKIDEGMKRLGRVISRYLDGPSGQ